MHRLEKKINTSGQKAYQRTDTEDRSLPYRNWLRTVSANGFFADLDMIKFKTVDGVPTPAAITELTRCDSETVSRPYLDAIIDRWFKRDNQADIIISLATTLNVPAYLICFQKDLLWLQVYSFQRHEWKEFTTDSWLDYLKTL